MAAPGNTNSQLDGTFNINQPTLTSDASSAIVTSTEDKLYVAPYIAAMYADASGQVGLLQQVTVTVTDIDRSFDIELTDTEAVKILKAFKVVDVSAGFLDSSQADVKVDTVTANAAEFKSALMAALGSGDLKDSEAVTLKNWLKAEARADTVKLLNYNTLSNLLEASDLLEFGIDLDASGGAANMWNAIDSGAAGLRRMLYTQLPIANTHAYAAPSDGSNGSAEIVDTLNFLPLVKGDKLALIFDVTVGKYTAASNVAPTSGATITSKVNDAQTLPADSTYVDNANVPNKYSQDLVFTRPSRRRVAVKLQMSTGGEAFGKSRAGNEVSLS